MSLFLISAARAVVEMLLLCFLGQALLYIVGGIAREANPIYRLFAMITRPPIIFVRRLLPLPGIPALTFTLLLALWFGLAVLKKSI